MVACTGSPTSQETENRQQLEEGETYEDYIFQGDDRRYCRHRRHLCDGARFGTDYWPRATGSTAGRRTSATANTNANATASSRTSGADSRTRTANSPNGHAYATTNGPNSHAYATANGPNSHAYATANGRAYATADSHVNATADSRASTTAGDTAYPDPAERFGRCRDTGFKRPGG